MLDAKIETFLQVAERNSFTAAAEALHLTQPAVTQHIHKLEAYYGCKLIDSTRRAVRLTDAGRMLYQYLSLQRANEKKFSELLLNVVEPLRIGATLSIADFYLPEQLVSQMLNGWERIRVTVGNTAYLLESLRDGILDCALIEGLFHSALLETRVFREASFLPVVAAGHPLLGREVSLAELHPYPLVLREPHSGTREVLENWLSQHNDAPQSFSRVIELGSFVLIKQLVRRSQAVTFVYEAVVREELANGTLAMLALDQFRVSHALHFVYRKGDIQHAAFDQFYQALLGKENHAVLYVKQ